MDLYPYTNFHELNLNWILATLAKIQDQVNSMSLPYMQLITDPAILAGQVNNKLRGVLQNCIFNAVSTDGWTDMPTGETDGMFMTMRYYNKDVEYPLIPDGSELVNDYKLIQFFLKANVSGGVTTADAYFRTVKSTNHTVVTSAWAEFTLTV